MVISHRRKAKIKAKLEAAAAREAAEAAAFFSQKPNRDVMPNVSESAMREFYERKFQKIDAYHEKEIRDAMIWKEKNSVLTREREEIEALARERSAFGRKQQEHTESALREIWEYERELEKKASDLGHKNETWKREMEQIILSLLRANSILQKKNELLEQDRGEDSNKITSLENKLIDLKQQVVALTIDMQEKDRHFTEMKKEIKSLKDEKSRLKEDVKWRNYPKTELDYEENSKEFGEFSMAKKGKRMRKNNKYKKKAKRSPAREGQDLAELKEDIQKVLKEAISNIFKERQARREFRNESMRPLNCKHEERQQRDLERRLRRLNGRERIRQELGHFYGI
ncbi:moesin/ezrin/radixin homolog 1-like [Macrobrachium nipponense]|uniref:moesin/ezrin/radixin homolog 1-like n=1 Tax=Macrobrachium nipponense TaxID=159736 RepID=UPI0030C8B0D8